MTLIIGCVARRGGISFVTDDEAWNVIDGRPMGRLTKVQPVPHLAAVVVASGSVLLGHRLHTYAMTTASLGSVDDLVAQAPDLLASTWAGLLERFGEAVAGFSGSPDRDPSPSGVLVAGQCADGDFAWWDLRAPDFDPVRQPDGWHVQPQPSAWDERTSLDGMVDAAVRLRAEHPDLYIGGQLWQTTLMPGPTFSIRRVHVFGEGRLSA